MSEAKKVTATPVYDHPGIQLWIDKYTLDIMFEKDHISVTVLNPDSIFKVSFTLDIKFFVTTIKQIEFALERYYA